MFICRIVQFCLYLGGVHIVTKEGVLRMDFILSQKRKEVLILIDRLGVTTNRQLEKFLPHLGVNTIRRGRQQLKELGFINEKSFGKRKVSTITKKGSEYVGNIMTGGGDSYSTLQHDLTANEIIYKLITSYKDKGHSVLYKTERELIREAFLALSYDEMKKPNKLRHLDKEVPDFVMKIGEQRIAFEVELSRKTNKRLQRKMYSYKNSISEGIYTSVFYICRDETIKKHVHLFSQGVGLNIKFIMLDSLIESEV